MGLNPNAVRNMKCRTLPSSVTADEIFAAKVKLAGLTILGLICSVILVVTPP